MNTKTVKALELIRDGISLYIESIFDDNNYVEGIPVEKHVEKHMEKPVEKPVENKTVITGHTFTPDGAPLQKEVSPDKEVSNDKEPESVDISDMNLKQLKEYAVSLGVTLPARSTKKTLLKLIEEQADKKTEESKSEDKESSDDESVESSETEEKADEEEESTDEFDEFVKEFEDYDTDELKDILRDADISTKGNRETLLEKIYKAVESGAIEFEDGDDEEESKDEEQEDSESEDEEPEVNDFEPEDTEERTDAVNEFKKDTLESFKNKELDIDDVKGFLEAYEVPVSKMSDKDIVNKYIEIASNMIDDDGEMHEEGAYEVRGVPYCCGVPLEDKGKGILKCSICGEEYEVE